MLEVEASKMDQTMRLISVQDSGMMRQFHLMIDDAPDQPAAVVVLVHQHIHIEDKTFIDTVVRLSGMDRSGRDKAGRNRLSRYILLRRRSVSANRSECGSAQIPHASEAP